MGILKKTNELIEKEPFWAETIRSIILGISGALLVATFIEIVKNDVEYTAEKKKARLSLKVDAIKNFADKSYRFTSLAYRFRENKITFDSLRDSYDDLRSAKHLTDVAFEDYDISKTTEGISTEMSDILNNVNNSLTDSVKFVRVRTRIKDQSDSIEVLALTKKL